MIKTKIIPTEDGTVTDHELSTFISGYVQENKDVGINTKLADIFRLGQQFAQPAPATGKHKPFIVANVKEIVEKEFDETGTVSSRMVEMLNEVAERYYGQAAQSNELTIDDLDGFDFYIINRREHKAIAINFTDDKQYTGYTFYKNNLDWEINPTKIGKGFITNMGEQLDFTKSFATAISVADQTK